jgi:RNA polymerase sigma-70 factor (ECF subfamily)
MNQSNLTDNELIIEFVSGKQSALEILLKRHKRKIFTYIYINVKVRSLAEDIFQDTFVKVIKSLKEGNYSDEGKFLSWVIRIAHNLVIDHFRKAKQMKMVSNDDYETDLFNNVRFSEKNRENELIREQIIKDVRNIIEFLPDDQKEVVVLRHYVGLSFKEIAEHTNVSINTALGRMRYALINLRKLIEEKNLVLTNY